MEINVERLFKTLMRRLWILIIIALLFGYVAYEYTDRYITPIYSATISMYIQNANNYKGNITSGDLNSSQALAGTISVLLKSNRVMEKVAQSISDIQISPGQLASMVSTSVVESTGILNITVRSENPYIAQKAVNAIGEVAPGELMAFLDAGKIELLDHANLPLFPSYPNVKQNILFAAIIGFVLSALAVMLIDLLDTRIKSEDDIKQITDIYLIGVIPQVEYKSFAKEKTNVKKKKHW